MAIIRALGERSLLLFGTAARESLAVSPVGGGGVTGRRQHGAGPKVCGGLKG
jgi:hypothetical protein